VVRNVNGPAVETGDVAIVGVDPRREAGKRLRAFVLDRMGVVGIPTLVALAEQADIAYDTLHAWFRGRPPTPRAGGRVSLTLGVTYSELLAAYEGGQPAGGRYVNDAELEALVQAAAEAAVARVLRDHDGRGRS
jgi:hypothetical protein